MGDLGHLLHMALEIVIEHDPALGDVQGTVVVLFDGIVAGLDQVGERLPALAHTQQDQPQRGLIQGGVGVFGVHQGPPPARVEHPYGAVKLPQEGRTVAQKDRNGKIEQQGKQLVLCTLRLLHGPLETVHGLTVAALDVVEDAPVFRGLLADILIPQGFDDLDPGVQAVKGRGKAVSQVGEHPGHKECQRQGAPIAEVLGDHSRLCEEPRGLVEVRSQQQAQPRDDQYRRHIEAALGRRQIPDRQTGHGRLEQFPRTPHVTPRHGRERLFVCQRGRLKTPSGPLQQTGQGRGLQTGRETLIGEHLQKALQAFLREVVPEP